MTPAIIDGLFQGMVYGILAVGLVVIYRGSRTINLSYGPTGMVAAFTFFELRQGFRLSGGNKALLYHHHSIWLPLVLAVGLGGVLGAATEVFVARPLRNQPRITVMIGTLAFGSLLLTFAIRRWGSNANQAEPLIHGTALTIGGYNVSWEQIVILIGATGVLVGLRLVERHTGLGAAVRASAVDPYAAGLTGINVNRISILTWTAAGVLSAGSAIVLAPTMTLSTGGTYDLLLRALVAAVVGGLTSVAGAFSAGLGLGLLESVITYKSTITGLTDLILAVVLIVVLFVRPAGLVQSRF